MTENMTKFLEFMSEQDAEANEKVSKLEMDALISWAAEKGITLTADDFVNDEQGEGEISLEEADNVAGGFKCQCCGAGGGSEESYFYSNEKGDGKCGCVAYGQGCYYENNEKKTRCRCPFAGSGESHMNYWHA